MLRGTTKTSSADMKLVYDCYPCINSLDETIVNVVFLCETFCNVPFVLHPHHVHPTPRRGPEGRPRNRCGVFGRGIEELSRRQHGMFGLWNDESSGCEWACSSFTADFDID
jgi:hypothetical protein